MSYNPFIKIEKEELAKLTFTCEFSNYLYYSESKGLQLGSLFETDEDTYDKIQKVLEGRDDTTIKKKDRVYILPGNNLPRPRIKEYLRSIGAYLTSDIDKATVIAGNNNIEDADMVQQAKIASMMFKTSDYRYVDKHAANDDDSVDRFIEDVKYYAAGDTSNLDIPNISCIISEKANCNIAYHSVVDYDNKDLYFMYPLTLKVLYKALSKKLPIINQDYFTKHAHSDLKLSDPEVYRSIMSMLDSSDDTNIELGVEILVHAKIDDNPYSKYHIWKLAKEHNWVLTSKRHDKNVKYFLEVSDWNTLNNLYGPDDYVNWANNNEYLNIEIFKELLPEIYEVEIRNQSSGFYNLVKAEGIECMNICYTLDEEWINYLKQEENDKQIIESV
jgi:hypothetical protein